VSSPAHNARTLRPGGEIRSQISGTQRDTIDIDIPANSYVRLVLDQLDIDLSAWLYDPAGVEVKEVKRPFNSMGWRDAPEVFVLEDAPAGRYRLEIGIFEAEDPERIGAYRLRIAEQLTLSERAMQLQTEAAAREALADTVAKWLSNAALPVTTVRVGSGFSDLEPLREILAGVRVVGLGEATHGTREFFQFKHRMLEFLVEELGFTHFAMEIGFAETLRIDEYVLHGTGDAEQALAGTKYTVWMTEEVLSLIEWLRSHNAALPLERRVRFVGVDMQAPTAAAERVLDYIGRVAPEYLGTATETLAPIRTQPFGGSPATSGRSPEEKAEAQRRLYSLVGYLSVREASFIRASSERDYRNALQAARTLQQYDRDASLTFRDQHERGFELRDRAMADNVTQLLQDAGPDARVALWAHNMHLDTQFQIWGAAQMGHFLKRTFGDEYYGLALTFDHGSFRAFGRRPDGSRGRTEFRVAATPPGWLEWYLARAAPPMYLLDLRSAPEHGPVRRWLDMEMPYRLVGATFDPAQEVMRLVRQAPLRQRFDGVMFIRETTAARGLQQRSPTP
jgi:erythromycin esterase